MWFLRQNSASFTVERDPGSRTSRGSTSRISHSRRTKKMLYRIVVLALFATVSAFNAPVSAVGASAIARAAIRAPAVVAMADEVEDKVKGIIAEQLGVELNTVLPGASFTEDLGADSLDAVELIMAIEEAFDIEIPDEEAETMTTPADCVKAIKGKL